MTTLICMKKPRYLLKRTKFAVIFSPLPITFGILLLIFDLFPGLLPIMSTALGITLPINMLTFLGLVFVLMIIFSQTIVISNLTRKSKRLTQEVGLLYKKVEDLESRVREDEAEKDATK